MIYIYIYITKIAYASYTVIINYNFFLQTMYKILEINNLFIVDLTKNL